MAATLAGGTARAEEMLLKAQFPPPNYQRIKQKVTITGQLLLDPHGKGVTKVPLQVAANVDYHQRWQAGDRPSRIRHYLAADAEIHYGPEGHAERVVSTLRDARRLVCLTEKQGQPLVFSPAGSLRREELELIDAPSGRIDLVELLPGRKLRVGESWQHSGPLMARLLNLDTVGVTDAASRLESIEGKRANIVLEGHVDGAVAGVATEIEIKGRYLFDSAAGRVVLCSLSFREKRAIAPTEPGFEVVTQLAMAEQQLAASEHLAPERLANLDLRPGTQAGHLEYDSVHGGFKLHFDPGWRMLLDQKTAAIFRYAHNHELIGQANLVRMPQSEIEAAISLEAYAQQVSKALAENLGQLVQSKQYQSAAGNRVLRVEATGVISEVPMRWIYYHLSNNDGQRLSCVVTVEEKLLETFADADALFIDGIELTPSIEPDPEPTPAKTARSP